MRATNSIVITVLVASSAHAFSTPRLTRPVVTTKHSAITTKRCSTSKMALEVVDPSYNLALGSIALGSIFGLPGSPLKNKITAFVPGALLAVFGLFIAFQTTTLRFTFDDDSFALVKADLSSTGENVVVGGANDWQYKTFVNCARNTHSLFIPPITHCVHSHSQGISCRPSPSQSSSTSERPRHPLMCARRCRSRSTRSTGRCTSSQRFRTRSSLRLASSRLAAQRFRACGGAREASA